MYCESCKVEFPENLRYCKWCGQSLREGTADLVQRPTRDLSVQPNADLRCTVCGDQLQVGMAYCKSCGAPVNEADAERWAAEQTRTQMYVSLTPDAVANWQAEQPRSTKDIAGNRPSAQTKIDDAVVVFSSSGSLEKPPDLEAAPPAQAQDQISTTIFDAETMNVESFTETIETGTAQIDSSTLIAESNTMPVSARSNRGSTTILSQDEWPNTDEPAAPLAQEKGRVTGRLPSQAEAELVATPPIAEEMPPATQTLLNYDGVFTPVSDNLPPAPSNTSQFSSPVAPPEQPPPAFGTLVMASESINEMVEREKHELASATTKIERSAELSPANETVPISPVPTSGALPANETIPIPQVPTATGQMPVTKGLEAPPPAPVTAQNVSLNDAAMQAFGIGESHPQETAPSVPVAPARIEARNYFVEQPYAAEVTAAKAMAAPTTTRRSSAPIVLVGFAALAIIGAGLLWWYLPQLKSLVQKPTPTGIDQPTSTPTPPLTEPPTTPIAPEGMAYVAAGSYTIGKDTGDEIESPAHTVELPGFFIDQTEVTNASYKKFVDATGRKPPVTWKDGKYPDSEANHPVAGVSWKDATDYAAWAGKRLPTEAEWEAAARGTRGQLYPWGNAWGEGLANIRGSSTTPVGQYKNGASPCGALDMVGNVWEWTSDEFKLYPGSAASLGNYDIKSGIVYRIIRGGSYNRRENIEATYRGFIDQNAAPEQTGFRCAKDVK